MHSIYRLPNSKEVFLDLYQEKLESLDIDYELRSVETSFGETNIILTGRKKAPPLVLIHSWNACAPIAIEDFSGLLGDFSVYAIDVLGQPNLSAEYRPNVYGSAYGEWLYEIISFLNLNQVYLVGLSFGAFIAWKALLHDTRRISKAFFINPMGIIRPIAWQKLIGLQVPIHFFQYGPKSTLSNWCFRGMHTDHSDFAKQWMESLLQHFRWDLASVPAISKAQAQLIQRPVYVVASAEDKLYPGQQILTQSQNIFPAFAGGLLLKKNKHLPNSTGYQQIIAFIDRHR